MVPTWLKKFLNGPASFRDLFSSYLAHSSYLVLYPSVQSIRSSLVKIPNNFTEFNFKHAPREDIIRIINELHDKTSTGIDNIPLKLSK